MRHALPRGAASHGGYTTLKRGFAVACVGAVVIAVTAVGCTADHGTTATAPRAQGRQLTDAEHLLLEHAEALLVKKCMESKGFKYWAEQLLTVDDLKGGGYVLTDVAWARKHGYGSRLKERLQGIQHSDPNNTYANSLPEKRRVSYSRTLEGGPSSGMLTAELPAGGTVQTPRHSCQTEAKGRLYGDFETWFRAEKIATNLSPLYVPQLVKDKRFVRAVQQWSTCMRAAGHEFADPPSVREQLPTLTKGLDKDEAYAVEVGLAVDEADCANRTPLSKTAHTLQSEYRAKTVGRFAAEVATYERLSLTALARAKDITGTTA